MEATRELVSNPPSDPFLEDHSARHSLFIYHLNGRQIAARHVARNKTILDIKTQIADISNTERDNIKVYKFIHRELPESARVGDVANLGGATYVSAYNNLQPLGNITLTMLLDSIGPPPFVEPPRPREPQEQQQPQRQQVTWPPPSLRTRRRTDQQQAALRERRRRQRDRRLDRYDEDRAAFYNAIQRKAGHPIVMWDPAWVEEEPQQEQGQERPDPRQNPHQDAHPDSFAEEEW